MYVLILEEFNFFLHWRCKDEIINTAYLSIQEHNTLAVSSSMAFLVEKETFVVQIPFIAVVTWKHIIILEHCFPFLIDPRQRHMITRRMKSFLGGPYFFFIAQTSYEHLCITSQHEGTRRFVCPTELIFRFHLVHLYGSIRRQLDQQQYEEVALAFRIEALPPYLFFNKFDTADISPQPGRKQRIAPSGRVLSTHLIVLATRLQSTLGHSSKLFSINSGTHNNQSKIGVQRQRSTQQNKEHVCVDITFMSFIEDHVAGADANGIFYRYCRSLYRFVILVTITEVICIFMSSDGSDFELDLLVRIIDARYRAERLFGFLLWTQTIRPAVLIPCSVVSGGFDLGSASLVLLWPNRGKI
ncbi:hypothetical protein C0J52_07629 [Blattella germanica]|nr:hypothetical protein C0J52_07629 [Blattella germanica]